MPHPPALFRKRASNICLRLRRFRRGPEDSHSVAVRMQIDLTANPLQFNCEYKGVLVSVDFKVEVDRAFLIIQKASGQFRRGFRRQKFTLYKFKRFHRKRLSLSRGKSDSAEFIVLHAVIWNPEFDIYTETEEHLAI